MNLGRRLYEDPRPHSLVVRATPRGAGDRGPIPDHVTPKIASFKLLSLVPGINELGTPLDGSESNDVSDSFLWLGTPKLPSVDHSA